MDFTTTREALQNTLGQNLPQVLFALAVLIGGWIVAAIFRAVVRKSLGLLSVNERIRKESGNRIDVEGAAARGVYYLILLIALIAFFNALRLPLVSAPLQSLVDKVLGFIPNLIVGGVLILVAWLLATILRQGARTALSATNLDERLSQAADMKPLSTSLGNVVYGLVLLMFVPAVLEALQLEGLLYPVRNMLDEVLAMLPNIAAAIALGVVGWIVAKILRQVVTGLLEATGIDAWGRKMGLRESVQLSRMIGLLVFIFVFVPALIQALEALHMEAISRPATEVLGTFMNALPDLFAAAVILIVAFFLSDFLAGIASTLLSGFGFDRLPAKLGLSGVFPESTSPSRFVGKLIVFFVLLFAVVEAASVMGFYQVSDFVQTFIRFGGQVLLGVAIIGVGLWISNLAYAAIARMERPQAALMANLARFTILGIVFAMGLRAMDLANAIVEAAFYLTLGAVAVAFALSFGLGGREAAGKQMEHWLAKLRGES